ncbi:hypothetical protein Tco_1418433 [Tanacetum coccineum]
MTTSKRRWEQDGNNTEDDALVLGIHLLGEGHDLRFSEDDLLKQKEENDDPEKFNLDNITHGKQVDVLDKRKRDALYEYIRLRDLYKSTKNGATFDRLEFDAKRRLKKKLTGNINFKFRGRFKGLHRLRWRRWKKIRGARCEFKYKKWHFDIWRWPLRKKEWRTNVGGHMD